MTKKEIRQQQQKRIAITKAERRLKVSIEQLDRICSNLYLAQDDLSSYQYSTKRLDLVCTAIEKVKKALSQESKTLQSLLK